jgi:hypothetical protein
MKQNKNSADINLSKETILADFRLANLSRNLSIAGRREVLTGRQSLGFLATERRLYKLHWLNNSGMAIGDQVITAIRHG